MLLQVIGNYKQTNLERDYGIKSPKFKQLCIKIDFNNLQIDGTKIIVFENGHKYNEILMSLKNVQKKNIFFPI